MAEAAKPDVGASLGASDDVIGSLAARVRELSLRLATLEGELEAARRRIAVYEDFDARVQDSFSAALRAANQIRERAQVSAQAIAEEARARRPDAIDELESLRIERDALRKIIDEAAARPPRTEPGQAQPSIPIADMRSAATEALRGVFKELVEEIRASAPAAAPAAPAVHQAAQAPEAPPPRPDYSPPPFAPPSAPQMPEAQRPAATTPPPASTAIAADAPSAAPAMPSAPADSPWPSPPPRPQAAAPAAPQFPMVEEEDLPGDPRMSAMAQLGTPPAPAAPAAPPEALGAETEPVGEVQLVLSPIASFPRLVEVERRLQGLPIVRTVYARDFRNGVATLAIGLRHPMSVQEFATAVTSLEYPRLRVLSATGYVLELRIDTEASIA